MRAMFKKLVMIFGQCSVLLHYISITKSTHTAKYELIDGKLEYVFVRRCLPDEVLNTETRTNNVDSQILCSGVGI